MKFSKGTIRPVVTLSLLVVLIGVFYFVFNTKQTNVQPESIPMKLLEKASPKQFSAPPTATNGSNEMSESATNFDFAALDLKLLAAIVANPINKSSAVIQANDLVTLYSLNDKIKQTELSIAAIYHNYIVLVLDNQEYELRLSADSNNNLEAVPLQEAELDPEQIAIDKKRATEIGNRPKELEHIVVITPASNGFYVTPGINPALFRSAKFKEGDVLQTINGKDVNDPEELAQAKALIATAETLEFNVLRGGVLVTLYLDIPAQDLSISR